MIEDKIFETIKKHRMFDSSDTIVIGVSGGVDSMSLLHFFVNETENKVIVAHVNHMLRGEESNRDEFFVEQICKKYKVEFACKKVDVSEFAQTSKLGIEESARKVRYDFFKKTSEENNAKIATAHTLSDNIETVIFNFTRGTSLSGLCGIPPVRGNIVRPFIDVSRSEIEEYSEKYGIDFVNDSSNFSNEYSRNRIRHFVIPELKKINKSFENNAKKCISNLRDDNNFLDNVSFSNLKKANLNCYSICSLDGSIRNRVLKMILKEFDFNVENKHINLANRLIDSKINSFDIDRDRAVKIENNKIVCYSKKQEKLTNVQKEFILVPVNSISNYKREHDILFDAKEGFSYFEFRTRRPGDKFSLPKRNCTKSLKKLFNEMKIPVRVRKDLKILFDKVNKEIVWIESIGVSSGYVISRKTKNIGMIVEKSKL